MKYMVEDTSLKAIADAVRAKTKTEEVMSFPDEVVEKINELKKIPELTTPGTEADLLEGKELVDSEGNIVVGTIPTVGKPTVEFTMNYAGGRLYVTAGQEAGYTEGGSTIQSYALEKQAAKTITPSTRDQIAVSKYKYTTGEITVKGDPGLLGENIRKGISIFGVEGTYKDTISQLVDGSITKYEDDEITDIRKTAFAYCGSLTSVNFPAAQTINQSAFSNCSSLISIDFPAVQTIDNSAFTSCSSLISINFPVAQTIGPYSFYKCSKLIAVEIPKVTQIQGYGFAYNTSLKEINLPKVQTIMNNAFQACNALISVNCPLCLSIEKYSFQNCESLEKIDLPLVKSVGAYCFSYAYLLTTLIFRSETLCTLSNINAFSSTPIASGTGYIYVPSSLVDEYKAATNWSTYADQIRAIEDYPDITGG